jgi:molecular chaperone GrpE
MTTEKDRIEEAEETPVLDEQETPETEKSEAAAEAIDVAEEITEPEIEPVVEEIEEEEPLRLQFIRLQADFDNYRKRVARERTDLYLRANQDLIEELLPVIDHYEMGLENAMKHEADSSMVDGFKMVFDQMQKVLGKFNVTPIDSLGEAFDPHTQEAVSHLPSAEYAENLVMAQVRRGYKIGDKLLRAAQVVVSSGSPA